MVDPGPSTAGGEQPQEDPLAAALLKIAQLERAVESHEVVGHAIGILMGHHRIDSKRAFATLVRVSQHRNLRLRRLAEALIATATSEPTETPRELVDAVAELLEDGSP
jgi:hypothetical protein